MKTQFIKPRKFIVSNAYVRKEERYKINNIGFHLRKLDKEGQTKSKVRRREIRFRSEISETENRK